PVRYYDPDAFREWLGGRTVHEAARQKKPLAVVSGKRLWKAVMFLYFLLTKEGDGRFSKRRFENFLANPPYGKGRAPSRPVLCGPAKAWAAEAGVGSRFLLKKARKAVGVQVLRTGRGPTRETRWFLRGPVVMIPTPESSAPAARTPGPQK